MKHALHITMNQKETFKQLFKISFPYLSPYLQDFCSLTLKDLKDQIACFHLPVVIRENSKHSHSSFIDSSQSYLHELWCDPFITYDSFMGIHIPCGDSVQFNPGIFFDAYQDACRSPHTPVILLLRNANYLPREFLIILQEIIRCREFTIENKTLHLPPNLIFVLTEYNNSDHKDPSFYDRFLVKEYSDSHENLPLPDADLLMNLTHLTIIKQVGN